MRKLSAAVLQLISQPELKPFIMVQVTTPTVQLLDTTAGFDIALPSIGTFSANNGLLSIDPPKITNITDRSSYKISYADPTFSKRALFESVITGSQVTFYTGFFNTIPNTTLNGANYGEPLINMEDILVGFQGIVDTQGYTVDPTNGTVIAVIECSSPMASLGMTKSLYTSSDSSAQRLPIGTTDTAYNMVYAGSLPVAMLWGKP
jgi:hypothetical protein